MPILKACTKCGRPSPNRRCSEHEHKDTRPSARQRGYDAQWERTRAEYLAAHPICEEPAGCMARATDVHHLDGLGPKGPRGRDPENLQALCHSHHSRHTASHQSGGWNARHD